MLNYQRVSFHLRSSNVAFWKIPNRGFDGNIIYGIFHCHVWLPEGTFDLGDWQGLASWLIQILSNLWPCYFRIVNITFWTRHNPRVIPIQGQGQSRVEMGEFVNVCSEGIGHDLPSYWFYSLGSSMDPGSIRHHTHRLWVSLQAVPDRWDVFEATHLGWDGGWRPDVDGFFITGTSYWGSQEARTGTWRAMLPSKVWVAIYGVK